MLKADEEASSLDLTNIIKVMPEYLKIARRYKRLAELLETQGNVTENIKAFINNINILTSENINASMSNSVQPIRKYVNSLKAFTTQVSLTTAKIHIYVSSMDKAKRAMKSLDDQIINKQQKRNKALDDLNERINNISNAVKNLTEAVYQMSDAFDYVNETDILSMFKGTQDLIEKVTGIQQSDNEISSDNTNNTTQVRPRPIRPERQSTRPMNNNEQGNRTTNYNMSHGFRPNGMVTFNFKNYSLIGEYTIR